MRFRLQITLLSIALLLVNFEAQGQHHPTSRVDSLLREARALIGTPYRYGATGNGAFDCTGFTMRLFSRYGYTLARSAAAQAKQGRAIPRDSLRKGDLVVFSGRRVSKSVAGHIGIVLDADSTGNFTFIHACHRGVIISNFASESYYRKRYISARRVLRDEELRYPKFEQLLKEPLELYPPFRVEIAWQDIRLPHYEKRKRVSKGKR